MIQATALGTSSSWTGRCEHRSPAGFPGCALVETEFASRFVNTACRSTPRQNPFPMGTARPVGASAGRPAPDPDRFGCDAVARPGFSALRVISGMPICPAWRCQTGSACHPFVETRAEDFLGSRCLGHKIMCRLLCLRADNRDFQEPLAFQESAAVRAPAFASSTIMSLALSAIMFTAAFVLPETEVLADFRS